MPARSTRSLLPSRSSRVAPCHIRPEHGRVRFPQPPPRRGIRTLRRVPHRYGGVMSRHVQVTFDARDPRRLSTFWAAALGYVHPAPPGVELPEGADPLAAWDEFLERVGVPPEQRN